MIEKKLNHHITQKITDNNHHSNENIISRHFSIGNVQDKTPTDETKTRQNRPLGSESHWIFRIWHEAPI